MQEAMDKSLKTMLNSEDLQQYTIEDRDTDFEEALQNGGGKITKSGLISVKAGVRNRDKGKGTEGKKHGKRKGNTIKVSSVKKKLRNIFFLVQSTCLLLCFMKILVIFIAYAVSAIESHMCTRALW